MPDDLFLPEMPERESAYEVLIQLRPALSQIPAAEFMPIRATPDRAWVLIRDLHNRITALWPDIEAEFSAKRIALTRQALDELPSLGLAYLASDLQVESAQSKKKRPELQRLEEQIAKGHSTLSEWAGKIFLSHPEESTVVKRLLSGRGANNTAKDMVGFCALFDRQQDYLTRQKWWDVLQNYGIDMNYIHLQARLATEWIVSSKEPGLLPTRVVLRSQAYTLLDKAYRSLTLVGRFLRPKEEWPMLVGKYPARPKDKDD